jgi:hypothetical protein
MLKDQRESRKWHDLSSVYKKVTVAFVEESINQWGVRERGNVKSPDAGSAVQYSRLPRKQNQDTIPRRFFFSMLSIFENARL